MNVLSGVEVSNVFASSLMKQQSLENMSANSLNNGIRLYQEKDYKGAAQAFRGAIALLPSSSFTKDAAKYLAMSELKLGRVDKAVEAYEKSIELNPNSDEPHVDLARLYFSQNKYKEAEQEYAKAAELNPSAVNYYSLGQAQLFQGKFSEAESSMNKVLHLAPDDPNSFYGMGLVHSKQGRYEKAVEYFESAIELKRDFYDAYAEIGYAYADMGQMEDAEKILEILEKNAPALEDSLSRYMYKADPPKLAFAHAASTFSYRRTRMTSLKDLDSYLENANASKKFTVIFQFNKEMDRLSVEDRFNWKISRSSGTGPGEAYNYGFAVANTEIRLPSYPDHVYYDADSLTARVQFTLTQNDTVDGTIDPSHVEFKFSGEDKWGRAIDKDGDQFTGFSGVF